MSFCLLAPDLVRAIHDEVLTPVELQGEARDKSLEGALARVDSRLAYGMITDVFDLAAAYTVAIATKRTAYLAMDVCLDLNGVEIAWQAEQVGDVIVAAARGQVDAVELAEWLRRKAEENG